MTAMDWRTFQARQQVLELGDRFISYIDEGAGDPVVLLHGIPTWGYLYHQIIPVLARTHRVLVPDLLGFGSSDRRDVFDRSLRAQGEALIAWLDQLGVAQAALVGHDIGGGVALRLAALAPQRVARLGLMHAVSYDSWPLRSMTQLGQPQVHYNLSAGNLLKLIRLVMRRGFDRPVDDRVPEGLLAPYRTEVGKLSLVRDAVALNTNLTMELTPLLSRIAAPTLLLWGEDDTLQPIEFAERLRFDIPRSTLVRVKNARHFVMLDQPEQVAEHIQRLLQG
jgi:pimeloyl-ACP methyl ester carboxylesterase